MRSDLSPARKQLQPGGIAPPELRFEVLQLIEQLAASYGQGNVRGRCSDLGSIKTVTPQRCLFVYAPEVRRNRGAGSRGLAEPVELRMETVPLRASHQNVLRKQRLPPQGDQTGAIQ